MLIYLERSGLRQKFLNLQEVTPKSDESQSGAHATMPRIPSASSSYRLGLTAESQLTGKPVDEAQAACYSRAG